MKRQFVTLDERKMRRRTSRVALALRALRGDWHHLILGGATRLGWRHVDIKASPDKQHVIAITVTSDEAYCEAVGEIP